MNFEKGDIDTEIKMCYKKAMNKEFGADFLCGVYRYNILINKEKSPKLVRVDGIFNDFWSHTDLHNRL